LPPLEFRDAVKRFGYTKSLLNPHHFEKLCQDIGIAPIKNNLLSDDPNQVSQVLTELQNYE
jgi:hypothetical protein